MQTQPAQIFNPFDYLKSGITNIDPVSFCENNLTLDGNDFKIHGNGYKPYADIYRQIGVDCLKKEGSKPVILVKGRQVGATTMAAALEFYFMASGMFGRNGKPPMRVVHAFPTLIHVHLYAKTKFNPMMKGAKTYGMKGQKKISIIEAKLDKTSATNDSLQFKQFEGENFVRIESTGIDADRLRGGTADVMLYDECFPYDQNIITENGKMTIGKLHRLFLSKKDVPKVLTYNETTECFEYKNIINSWNRGKRSLCTVICENRKIKCTDNHRFLTTDGWVEAKKLNIGDVIKTTTPDINQLSISLNDDQWQVILGSFLGDGHIEKIGKNKYRLRERHGKKQTDYCKWKAGLFNCDVRYIDKNGYSQTPCVEFNTKTFVTKYEFPKNKQHCPQWILDQLDERGLAVWFMDDGTTCKNINARFETCSFNEDSQKRIVEKLRSFGIDCEYRFVKLYDHRSPGYFNIFIYANGYKTLNKLISEYIHKDLEYKLKYTVDKKYQWSNKFNNYGLIVVKDVIGYTGEDEVYDIEVEDNHNFIVGSVRRSKNLGGLIAHNCQDIPQLAIANANKMLTTAKYGKNGKGVQVYFGTPKSRNSQYYKMWSESSQNYYYLGCEKCEKHFPLYLPGGENWYKVWLYGFMVQCSHCGHIQDKREAAERGKWISVRNPNDPEPKMIGYHINQLYNPIFKREDIEAEKPENSLVNTERAWMNEVLGEFFAGDMGPISKEEIIEKCGDANRSMVAQITEDNFKIFAGFDWGKRNDADAVGKDEAKRQGGQSYSTCVVIREEGPGRLEIVYAGIVKKNDNQYKRDYIHEVMRKYKVTQAVGDYGFAHELTEDMHRDYNNRFLGCELIGKVNGHIRLNEASTPPVIQAQREYHIEEVFNIMKRGMIRFPLGGPRGPNSGVHRIDWLIDHCSSMEEKITFNIVNEPVRRFVKGSTPNDGMMALVNAYIAYKYFITNGFSDNKKGIFEKKGPSKIMAITGYCPRL